MIIYGILSKGTTIISLFKGTTMEIELINCFRCVIPTINFQRLKILLVSLLFFIVKYIFLENKFIIPTKNYLCIK